MVVAAVEVECMTPGGTGGAGGAGGGGTGGII